MNWRIVGPVLVMAMAFAQNASAQGQPCLNAEAKAEINRIKEANRTSATDQNVPFDPDYFVGTWELEWDRPDSPLGEAGPFVATVSIRHVDRCSYEGDLKGEDPSGPLSSKIKVTYDPASKRLEWMETYSRGYTIARTGQITGDPGGVFTHYWESPPLKVKGSAVQLTGTTILTSPSAFRLRAQISTDGEPPRNFGNPWFEKK